MQFAGAVPRTPRWEEPRTARQPKPRHRASRRRWFARLGGRRQKLGPDGKFAVQQATFRAREMREIDLDPLAHIEGPPAGRRDSFVTADYRTIPSHVGG